MSRRPPPPPPPPGGSSTTFGGSSSAGGYYSSNNAGSASSTATQRLGLNNSSNRRQQQQQQPSSITTTGGGGSSSTSDDWFASSAPSAPAPTPAPIAPNSGSGFYSSTTTTANNNNSSMYSTNNTNNYGVNTNTNNNPYAGGIGSATVSSSSNSGGGYYGGSMNTPTTAMSGAIGGGGGTTTIPSTSAFGSNPNSGSTGHIQGATTSSNSYELSGAIGAVPSSAAAVPTPHVFDPNAAAAAAAAKTSDANNNMTAAPQYEEDYDNEPPLLEELGVNFPHIYSKSRAVVFPFGKHAKSLESGLIENDADLAGPLAFALGLGGELLLAGKMHFGYVYGFGLSGCFAMTLLLNLLNPNGAVSIWTVISILGYALLPVNLLAGVNALFRVHKLGVWGMVMAVLTIVWCTTASSRLFERGCNMRAQRFLLAYPTALLYSAFVMITIF